MVLYRCSERRITNIRYDCSLLDKSLHMYKRASQILEVFINANQSSDKTRILICTIPDHLDEELRPSLSTYLNSNVFEQDIKMCWLITIRYTMCTHWTLDPVPCDAQRASRCAFTNPSGYMAQACPDYTTPTVYKEGYCWDCTMQRLQTLSNNTDRN